MSSHSAHAKQVPPPAKRQEISSVTGGPLLIALPKVTVTRTHQDQRANPLVKSMNLPSESVEAGSSLSTKQRVAAGVPPPPSRPKPLLLGAKKSLPLLSFKKNKPPVLPSQMKETTITPNVSVATPTSPAALPKDIIDDADIVASPQPMDIDQSVDLWRSTLDDAGSLGRRYVIRRKWSLSDL